MEFIHSFSLALSNPQFTEPEGSYQRIRLTVSPGNYSAVIPALDKEDNNSVVNIIYQVDSCHITCMRSHNIIYIN